MPSNSVKRLIEALLSEEKAPAKLSERVLPILAAFSRSGAISLPRSLADVGRGNELVLRLLEFGFTPGALANPEVCIGVSKMLTWMLQQFWWPFTPETVALTGNPASIIDWICKIDLSAHNYSAPAFTALHVAHAFTQYFPEACVGLLETSTNEGALRDWVSFQAILRVVKSDVAPFISLPSNAREVAWRSPLYARRPLLLCGSVRELWEEIERERFSEFGLDEFDVRSSSVDSIELASFTHTLSLTRDSGVASYRLKRLRGLGPEFLCTDTARFGNGSGRASKPTLRFSVGKSVDENSALMSTPNSDGLAILHYWANKVLASQTLAGRAREMVLEAEAKRMRSIKGQT